MSVQPHGGTEQVTAAWQALTGWLAEHAPVSHASLLPPAGEEDIAAADSLLTRYAGYGLPAELVALWRLCGGVEHQYIEENEEHGEVGSGAFLPDGVLLPPREAVRPRLPEPGRPDYWNGARVVPWLTPDEAGPEFGQYAGSGGVGHWSTMAGPEVSEPRHPSVAAYLEAVHRTLTVGPADLMGPDVPGIVYGCLVWENPDHPGMDEAFEHWTPLH
ncbi:hypothetical protein [Streptomyces pini]|uniref:Cell wall assembly regulator SMI1 n=1 Tax=Streptomyces pini TaxID=1520580 RepID=A0A1I3Z441_9ACTN|nr:hypothetical protein [Streptomyces pini]SFK38770.1 hypothetical protein SAMN05192584_105313 [Streptomyces pini]